MREFTRRELLGDALALLTGLLMGLGIVAPFAYVIVWHVQRLQEIAVGG